MKRWFLLALACLPVAASLLGVQSAPEKFAVVVGACAALAVMFTARRNSVGPWAAATATATAAATAVLWTQGTQLDIAVGASLVTGVLSAVTAALLKANTAG